MAALLLYPESYRTTGISDTFTDGHHVLEYPRQRIGQALREFTHPYETDIHNPHTDIRETLKHYFIEVELPGATTGDFSLKWTNSRTLLFQAEIRRPGIEEAHNEVDLRVESQQNKSEKQKKTHDAVHMLVHERRLGKFARAFHFNVEVDHESLEAKMQCGLLRLAIAKKQSEHTATKDVEVKSDDS